MPSSKSGGFDVSASRSGEASSASVRPSGVLVRSSSWTCPCSASIPKSSPLKRLRNFGLRGSVMSYSSSPTVPSVALFPQSWSPIPRMSRPRIFITCMSSMDVSA